MTVEAAYDESKRNRVRAPRSRRGRGNADQTDSTENHDAQDAGAPGREHGVDEIKAFLADVRARADALVDAAAFAKQDARAALFPAYRAALERLQFFGRMLGVEDEALPRQNALENPD
jgi:hypothetical protein